MLLYHHRKNRTQDLNFKLGCFMSAIAGAINAGGFLAIGQYTSHVTGHLSRMADSIVLNHWSIAGIALGMAISFFLGSMISSGFVILFKRYRFRSCFAIPMLFEIIWLLTFGYLGFKHQYSQEHLVAITWLLSFIMGIHNSIISKISHTQIKTTHMTGIITDMGIESAQFFSALNTEMRSAILRKLKIHATILFCFISGAILGAMMFKLIGYITVVILSCFMLYITINPIKLDIHLRLKLMRLR